MEQNIIQSTTVKTIKELKKQSELRTSVEDQESTESGKCTPDAQSSKTQYTKFRLTKKASINILLPKMSQSTIPETQPQKTEEFSSNKSIAFKRNMNRYATQKQQQQVPPPLCQIDEHQAMNLILNRSKTLQDFYQQNQLTSPEMHSFITDNKQFVFTFMAFLTKLVHKGLLSQQLSNIQKPVLTSIEQFTMTQVSREITRKQIDKQYREQLRKVDNQFTKFQRALNDIEVMYF